MGFETNPFMPDSNASRLSSSKAFADLHLRWLSFTLADCTREVQSSLTQIYLADPRFQSYYDRSVPNCAAFLATACESRK